MPSNSFSARVKALSAGRRFSDGRREIDAYLLFILVELVFKQYRVEARLVYSFLIS